MPIPDDLQLMVKLPITLNKDRREAELAAIHALPRARPFLQPDGDTQRGSVCVCVPSILEVPSVLGSFGHELIDRAVDVLRAHRMRFIWGRNVFPAWQGNIVQGRSDADDVFNPAAWALPIAQVTQEAPLLGAVATFLSCEPIGDHPGVSTWKKGLDPVQRERVIAAIVAARVQIGHGVDFCHPAGFSWNPIHFGWATRYVANLEGRIAHQTYRLRDTGEANPTPPAGMTPDMRWWSSWIHPDPQSVDGDKKPLSIDEFRGMDWKAIQKDWPDLRGVVVYGGNQLPWLLAELGKGE